MFVNQISIEKVFLEERFFQDSNIKLESWKDEFIIELLNWYNDKLRTLRMRKGTGCINEWKQYYQQIVRMLYYAVVKLNIRDKISLKNVFEYFFEVEDDDPYRNDPDMISAEKLLNVYFYIVKKIGKKSYEDLQKNDTNYNELYPFVGRWDNEIMKDLCDHLMINYICEDGKILYSEPVYRDDFEDEQYTDPEISDSDNETPESDSDSEYMEPQKELSVEELFEQIVDRFVNAILDGMERRAKKENPE